MVTFYNSSITSSDSSITTMKIDLVLDWNKQSIDVFVGGSYAGDC